MRFDRFPRNTDTPRDCAALCRSGGPDVQNTARPGRGRSRRDPRATNARSWRKARMKLAGYPPAERMALRAHWQRCSWPATAGYLMTFLHMFDAGQIGIEAAL